MVAINLEKLDAITTNQKATAKLDHVQKRSFPNRYAADIQKGNLMILSLKERVFWKKQVLSSR